MGALGGKRSRGSRQWGRPGDVEEVPGVGGVARWGSLCGGISPGLLTLQVLHGQHRAGEHLALVQLGQSWGARRGHGGTGGTECVGGCRGLGDTGAWGTRGAEEDTGGWGDTVGHGEAGDT